MKRHRLALLLVAAGTAAAATTAFAQLPEDRRTLTRTVSYAEMEAFLAGVSGKGPITTSVEATTAKGRSVHVVHATRGGTPSFRVLFYAQQHGDEVSGKDALLYLVRDIARKPDLLPPDVDLWILPMVNPDGAEAGTRRNAAGTDLNRDHLTLEQPETQALHRVARRVRPHVAVDCHEFTRDSEGRRKRGWVAWPDITMDGVNNPLFESSVIAAAQRWVDESEAPVAAAGHTFLRYSVGGQPPREEQRHSAPDLDSGLNAVGMYGGLSFIIEAAVRRSAPDPSADLAARVDAYLVLFWRFIRETGHRAEDLAAVERARARPLPPFLPTNYLWVNPGMTVTEFPVIEAATGRTLRIPTANMMTTLAVKTTVPTPLGYAIEPAAAADFQPLLERHGIPFETARGAEGRPGRVVHARAPRGRARRGLLPVRGPADRPLRGRRRAVAARRDALRAALGRGRRPRRARSRAGAALRPLRGAALPEARDAGVGRPRPARGPVAAMRALGVPLLSRGGVLAPSGAAGQSSARRVADDFVSARPAPPVPAPLAAALAGIRPEVARRARRVPGVAGARGARPGQPRPRRRRRVRRRDAGPRRRPAPREPGRTAGARSYFHAVPLREVVDHAGEVAIETRRGGTVRGLSFASGAECLLSRSSPQVLTAPVVFAGFGIREEKRGHDDYAGLDVRGKVVLVLRGVPDGEAWREPGLVGRYDPVDPDERWEAKLETARAAGAAAVLAAEGDDFAKVVADETTAGELLPPVDAAEEAPLLARLSSDAVRMLFDAAGLDADSPRVAKPRELPGVTATLRAKGTVRLASSRNVIGVLAGSDPKLRDEAVVVGAHVDHLGTEGGASTRAPTTTRPASRRCSRWPGPSRRLPSRPKRTVVFALWTGEEDGKLGSGHYVRHPAWPLARTVAYVNLDMIGHPWLPEEMRKLVTDAGLPDREAFLAATKPAEFAEPGLPPDAPEIEAALRWAGPATGMTLHLDRTDGTHGGSDYRDFARARVPFIRFFGNFFPGYHEKGDSPENLDPAQVQRMARLALATAWRLAEP